MSRLRIVLPFAVTVAVAAGIAIGLAWHSRQVLDSVETVIIEDADLDFQARLDTGAVVSSINALELEVIGGGERPSRDDVGKPLSFVLVNHRGEKRRLSRPIEQVRGIRSADCREVRYHVYLNVRFRGETTRILMNLNDRTRSGEKLLLGRNWLGSRWLVATTMDKSL